MPTASAGASAAELRDQIAVAAEVLRRGRLVAFPTETVYGLGASATDPSAVARIFEVKGRPVGHPLIVHLGATHRLDRWAIDAPPAAHQLAEAFWPGPLTIVLRRSPLVPPVVTGGHDTVGLRVPDHPVALALLDAFGGGIAAPSANRFGGVSPTSAAHVRADLGDAVDLILEGGASDVGVESTIVDLSAPSSAPVVLRPGSITTDAVEAVLGVPVGGHPGTSATPAPGTLASHYAPAARVELAVDDEVATRARALHAAGVVVAVLAPDVVRALPAGVVELGAAGAPADYARCLYDRLRAADELGVQVVLTVPPPPEGVGTAVRDRLARASAGGGGAS